MSEPALATAGKVVVVKVIDKIKWLMVDGVFYVHPDHIIEFEEKHGPLTE